MAIITEIKQLTSSKYVNLFNVKGHNSKGHESNYFVASRAKSVDELKITTKKDTPDGVSIYALCGEKHDKVVLVRQYRYAIDDYIYELPAGLVEPGENLHEAAIREMHEETGLVFTPIEAGNAYEAPRYTTIGMTDEAVAAVYGYASGDISDKFMEASEEIEVVIADRDEVRRILDKERVALLTAYQLMHFIADKEPFGFLK